MFVAEVDKKVVGIQASSQEYRFDATYSHNRNMSNFRYKIGRLLAETSFTFAKAKNYVKIAIQVIADNTRLRFYGNLGFEKIGIAKKHVKFEDRFCDVFYLEKFLIDDP